MLKLRMCCTLYRGTLRACFFCHRKYHETKSSMLFFLDWLEFLFRTLQRNWHHEAISRWPYLQEIRRFSLCHSHGHTYLTKLTIDVYDIWCFFTIFFTFYKNVPLIFLFPKCTEHTMFGCLHFPGSVFIHSWYPLPIYLIGHPTTYIQLQTLSGKKRLQENVINLPFEDAICVKSGESF